MKSTLLYIIEPCLIGSNYYSEPFRFVDCGCPQRAINLDAKQVGLAVSRTPFYADLYRFDETLDEDVRDLLRDFLESVLDFPEDMQSSDHARLIANIPKELEATLDYEEFPPPLPMLINPDPEPIPEPVAVPVKKSAAKPRKKPAAKKAAKPRRKNVAAVVSPDE